MVPLITPQEGISDTGTPVLNIDRRLRTLSLLKPEGTLGPYALMVKPTRAFSFSREGLICDC